ncbi:MAG: tRNA (guanosine(46)-N(7))-methyltransferase TrmB [Rhizobiaceae bacterium]
MKQERPERSSEAFFGRRKGKPLRANQAAALERCLSALAIDLSTPAPKNVCSLFSSPVREVRLEIGFGGGEHLLHQIEKWPQTGFVGVEPFVNGMAKLCAALGNELPGNLRLYDDDATGVLDWLPENSISGLDLLYPDPWPKKKHWKRRFVSQPNLDRFARIMKSGADFRFASDIDTYVNWTLLHCRYHPSFEWLADTAADWNEPFNGWPGTRYEAKALREGRRPAYLTFRRI